MATGNVYGHMKENNEALSDIPEWHITKNGQEPTYCDHLHCLSEAESIAVSITTLFETDKTLLTCL